MRKRIWLIALVLVAVLVVVFGISAAFAYGNTDPETPESNGCGGDMAGQYHSAGGMMGNGMMGSGVTDNVTEDTDNVVEEMMSGCGGSDGMMDGGTMGNSTMGSGVTGGGMMGSGMMGSGVTGNGMMGGGMMGNW